VVNVHLNAVQAMTAQAKAAEPCRWRAPCAKAGSSWPSGTAGPE
jgi:hypothetical protein